MIAQLPLSLRWPAHQRFEQFVPGPNDAALAVVREAVEGQGAAWPFLAGAEGTGKTHLLIAACQAASAAGRRVQYLPLRMRRGAVEGMLRGASGSQMLALDDVHEVAGDAAAEHALFDLYNRARAEQMTLLFAARVAPGQLGLGLPDLRSRLAACTQLPLRALDDAARREVLRSHAAARGLHLDAPVLDWIFNHHARDLGALHALLERLDRASLAARRRVTIPFVRECLHTGIAPTHEEGTP